MSRQLQATVAIPTFCREEVLLNTIHSLLEQTTPAAEILVVDQTPKHKSQTEGVLHSLENKKAIRWIRLEKPSITEAMNKALLEATSPIVLFVDDDIVPDPALIEAHLQNYEQEAVWGVAGQVLQPGQTPVTLPIQWLTQGFAAYLNFPFHSATGELIENGMAGNLSLRKEKALEVGGFDENFIGAAYRFETEFCRRMVRAGGKIRFAPEASVRHLRSSTGGTRTLGSHLCSISGSHGVGDYYFAFREGLSVSSIKYIAFRPLREVATRYHLKHPWCIPVKLVGEARAFLQAIKLASKGPSLPFEPRFMSTRLYS